MIVNDSRVRVRKGPITDTEIITVLEKGTRLTYNNMYLIRETIGNDDDICYEVTLPDGQTGFIFGAFVDRVR